MQFASDEWWAAFVDAVRGSEAYRKASAGWQGDVAFEIQAEPDKGIPETIWGRLELSGGECHGGGVVTEAEGMAAPYVIRAPYTRWKQVVRGQLDPVRGMMQGKLKLQGDLATIIRYVKAANELVNLAKTVPTEFADE